MEVFLYASNLSQKPKSYEKIAITLQQTVVIHCKRTSILRVYGKSITLWI
jgi:hypothetical protein